MSTDAKRKLRKQVTELFGEDHGEAPADCVTCFAWSLVRRLEAAEAENAELRTQADAWKKVAYSGDSVKTKMRREFDEEIDSLNLRLSEQSKALHDIRAKNTMLEKENAELRAKVAELEAETARLRDMAAVAFCAGRDA